MIWLLRLEWVGQIWYLASESCAPVNGSTTLAHHGTLSVSGFAEALELGGGVGGPCTADVSFHLGVDGWTLLRDGHRLDSARGEVSLWRRGTAYNARTVLVSGPLQSDTIPKDGEPFEASVSDRLIDLAADWPPADDVITAAAWPNAPADDDTFTVIGEPYPWPIGYLGAYIDDDGESKQTSTTKVIIVDDTAGAEVGVVAGGPISALAVTIWNKTDHDKSNFSPVFTTDGTGKTRTTVSFAGAPAGWLFDGSEEYYVTLLSGGLAANAGSQDAGMGNAILFLLLQRYDTDGPQAIDIGAWKGALGWLNAWRIGYGLEPGDPLDTITDEFLPLCPALFIMGGPRGLRPVILAPIEEADCRSLTVGRDLYKLEKRGIVENEVVNEVTIKFAYSAAYDKFRGTITIGAADTPDASASKSRSKTRAVTIEAAAVFDRGTAGLAARENVRMYGQKALYFVYPCPSEVGLSVGLGQRVKLTDEAEGIDGKLMWIYCRETDDGETWWITLLSG